MAAGVGSGTPPQAPHILKSTGTRGETMPRVALHPLGALHHYRTRAAKTGSGIPSSFTADLPWVFWRSGVGPEILHF